MALKKPSDFFGNNKKNPLDEVKEEYVAASPKKIEQVSEAFDAFKANLNHIQSLSDFTSTFDSFKENLEKVENVSSEVDTIKDEIKSLLKQEDLDSAMMAQLLFVEESISKIESKISSINGETVDQIKEDFKGLSTSVEGFLSIDVPKYKKLISESEVRVDDRFGQFKDKVEENLDTIRADVNKEVTTALSEVERLNTDTISEVKEDFRKNTKEVKNLVEEELPKYRKFFIETELKTEETIKNAIDSYKETIESLNAKVKVFTETEIPKYNNLLIETKLKSEQEVKELEEEVLAKVNSLSEKVDFVSGDVTEKTAEKIQELQTVIDEYKEEIDSISKTYNNLYKDFKKREISDNEKLESYSNEIEKYNKRFSFLEETVHEDLREIQSVLIRSNETYHTSLKAEVGKFRNKISEQMEGLQMDLVVNEQHIKKQNENIETVKEEIREVLKRLQLDTLEEKNKELVEKITYLEETISEINEKKLLVEDNPTLPGDPDTNNSADPLTPLDQKFVTFDQLQNHYRTFINRIQQQIATIGGGGAGVIHDLDDVTFDRTTGEGKLLIYDGAKWVGIASTALGSGGVVGAAGTWAVTSAGIHTTKNVGVGTTARSEYALYVKGDQYIDGNITVGGTVTYEDVKNVDSIGIVTARTGVDVLSGGINVVGVSTISTGIGTVQIGVGNTAVLVQGDARVTGILTVGTSSLTLDGNNDTVQVGTALTLGHTQGIQFHSQSLHASGLDVTNINASGIVTATSFRGDGSQLTNIISGVGIQSGSVRVGTGFTDINFTGAGVSSIVGAGDTVTIDIPATTIRRQYETASGTTTDFTITDGYTVGFIDVFLNGVKQRSGTDFLATTGTGVTMTPAVNNGDVLEFQIYENLTIGAQGNSIGVGGTWAVDSVGINTTKNVGIGTTASSSFDLIVNNTVSIGNTFTYPEYITGGMVPRAIKSQGGYERTLRFVDHQTQTEASQDPSDYIVYTQELASSGTWRRLGITTSGNSGRDNDWWGETNPNYDNTKGLFGGLTNPAGVNKFFDFDDNTAFNNAKTTGSLKYTQAVGSFSLKDCQVGDLVLARFDLNIMPMVTNTTVEIALIYANRNSSDTITNEFALTHTPLAYGSGTVGKGFLLRPTISAYIANDQDINSRSLLAIKADNPVRINPIGVLFTIQR